MTEETQGEWRYVGGAILDSCYRPPEIRHNLPQLVTIM